MYSIRIEGDVQPLLQKIESLSGLDKRGLNAALAETIRESTVERFRTGKDPSGKKWKTSIRAANEGGKTLVQSAHLRNSINSRADASGFAVGTNVIHAATHQLGADRTIRARKAKALHFQVGGRCVTKKAVRIRIPARPFLGLSDEDVEEIKATIDEYMED